MRSGEYFVWEELSEAALDGGVNVETQGELALGADEAAGFCYSRHYSLAHLTDLTQAIIKSTRLRILAKVRRSGLLSYEKIGRGSIYNTLTDSTFSISAVAVPLANVPASVVMLIVAACYVATISMTAFLMTLVCLAMGSGLYWFRKHRLDRQLVAAAQKEEEFFVRLNHLLDGFKEIKIHRPRADDLFDNYITEIAEESRTIRSATDREFANIIVFGRMFWYVLMAAIVFILPQLSDDDPDGISQIVAVILFIIGPMVEVISAAPLLARANVAIQTIDQLESRLDAVVPDPAETDGTYFVGGEDETFSAIEFKDLSFAYEVAEDAVPFHVGPLDLSIRSGELLFIIGGNGSGKSTVLKLLTGLYAPSSGRIFPRSFSHAGGATCI